MDSCLVITTISSIEFCACAGIAIESDTTAIDALDISLLLSIGCSLKLYYLKIEVLTNRKPIFIRSLEKLVLNV